MPLFWFVTGILTTLACLLLLLPWLRTIPRFSALPAVSKPASFSGVLILLLPFGLYAWLGHTDSPGSRILPSGVSEPAAGSFASAANLINAATGESATTPNTVGDSANGAGPRAMKSASGLSGSGSPGAGSMESAIASLESRLVKGGGGADDWELLAKSYEFLGRSADAVKARAHQLPASGFAASSGIESVPPAASAPTIAASGISLSGEVTIAQKLSSKAAAGETLFIVAKSVDAPGVPVAVLRISVGAWPMKFTLDDSLSMMPGRNLSSAGRVTVEARISQTGQALPASGDLQGATGVITPRDHPALKILIDRVIT